MTVHFRVASNDIVHEDFGGDMVILNLASGQYFGLNPAGSLVWAAILEGGTVDDLAENPKAQTWISDFVGHLKGFGLIVENPSGGKLGKAPLGLTEAPSIEVYDDLADLITADPIHDVDAQAGWPKLPDDG